MGQVGNVIGKSLFPYFFTKMKDYEIVIYIQSKKDEEEIHDPISEFLDSNIEKGTLYFVRVKEVKS